MQPADCLTESSNKGIGESEPHADRKTDHGYRVDQTGDQEHLALQHGSKFGLTGRAFKQLATQDAETDSGSKGAHT